MAKSASNKLNINLVWIIAAAALAVILFFGFKQYKEFTVYRTLATTPNQACRGLLNGHGIRIVGVDLEASGQIISSDDGRIAEYECLLGESIQESLIQDKVVPEYELGAKVSYFDSPQSANAYAENVLNQLRFWGVDAAGQEAGIPQTSSFTFLVSDAEPVYFDSYTVRDNRVFRLSMYCALSVGSEKRRGLDDLELCAEAMEPSIMNFADNSLPLFQ